MDNKKPIIGITQGDPSGVGLELIIRVFSDENIYKYCTPVLYANPKTFVAWKKHLALQEPMYTAGSSASEATPSRGAPRSETRRQKRRKKQSWKRRRTFFLSLDDKTCSNLMNYKYLRHKTEINP